MDSLRKVFAATKKAKQLGFRASRFTFNSKSGWCPECRGHGIKRIEMNFMPDFYVPCESCQGRRFNLQTLQVKYNEQSIADVLAMSIERAREFFDGFEHVARPLQAMLDVGLGYLTLGQSTVTLSGGESQRLKLATELARRDTGHTLYVLDEPTTGLHVEDIRVLLSALHRLVDNHNSMIVIEHNLDVIRCADWVIDLGPDGGDGGGELLACGTPEQIAMVAKSCTGRYLRL
jgi:excinuclease ABC subunit A